MIEIKQLTLFKNSGWMALDGEKKRGIFCYLSEGTFRRKSGKEVKYKKIRLADVFATKNKQGDNYLAYVRGGKQKFANVGFYPELAPYVTKIIVKICSEIQGKSGDTAEKAMIDKVLKQSGGRF